MFMLGFSVIQLVRRNGHKLDKNIRELQADCFFR